MEQFLIFTLCSLSCHHLEKTSIPPAPTWSVNEQESNRDLVILKVFSNLDDSMRLMLGVSDPLEKQNYQERCLTSMQTELLSHSPSSCHQKKGVTKKEGRKKKESQQVTFTSKKKRLTWRNSIGILLLKENIREREVMNMSSVGAQITATSSLSRLLVTKLHSPSTGVFVCSFQPVAPQG